VSGEEEKTVNFTNEEEIITAGNAAGVSGGIMSDCTFIAKKGRSSRT